jgi:hypothetical protein
MWKLTVAAQFLF